jgi:hypothetical protein
MQHFPGQSFDRHILALRVLADRLVEMHDLFVHFSPACQRLARQHFPWRMRVAVYNYRCWRVMRAMPVIVIFQVFEYVADVQKCVAIQADVDESRLHAW